MSRKTDTGPRDPVGNTISPIAEALENFSSGPPDENITRQSLKFEYLYQRLGIDLVRVWLDGSGFSDGAREFRERLLCFLVSLCKWERQCIDISQATTLDQFQAYQDTDYRGYWKLKQEYDELIDQADQTAKYLRNLATVVQAKAGRKADE